MDRWEIAEWKRLEMENTTRNMLQGMGKKGCLCAEGGSAGTWEVLISPVV